MATMPSTRTKRLFNKYGYTTQMVERFIPGIGIRKDFLGCIDVLAMKKNVSTVIGIQCFSTAWSAHVRKIVEGEEPYAKEGAIFWLGLQYTELWFVGFRKLKVKRGGVAYRWVPRWGRVELTSNGDLKITEVDSFNKEGKWYD